MEYGKIWTEQWKICKKNGKGIRDEKRYACQDGLIYIVSLVYIPVVDRNEVIE